jgi:hypothetical protein
VVNLAPICYCHVWNTRYHFLLNLFQRGSKFTSVFQGEDYGCLFLLGIVGAIGYWA